MAAQPETGLTLEDLFTFPDDGRKRELIGGRLYVSPQPRLRHQLVISRLDYSFRGYVEVHGGDVFPGANVDPAVGDHVEPDVVALAADYDGPRNELSILTAPSLVVEVSSPSTQRYDLDDKRPLYERHGVPEFWFVDLEEEHVRVFRLAEGRYGEPDIVQRGGALQPRAFPGLVLEVDYLLA